MRRTILISTVTAIFLISGCGDTAPAKTEVTQKSEVKEESKKSVETTAQKSKEVKKESTQAKEETKKAVEAVKEKVAEAPKAEAKKVAEAVAQKAAQAKEETKKAVEAVKEKVAEAPKAEAKKVAEAVAQKAAQAKEETKKAVEAVKEKVAEAPKAEAKKAKKVASAEAKKLFMKCAACHGVDGKTKAMGKSEIIASQSATELEKKLIEYKNGNRNVSGMGAVMKTQATPLSDADIKLLADYISSLK